MFGTTQRVPGRSPEITRLRGSIIWQHGAEIQADGYDRLWVCKLNMFLMQRPLHYICYQLSSWREAWLTQSRKASSMKLLPNGAIAATTGAIKDGFRYPLYSMSVELEGIFSSKKAHHWRKQSAWWRDSDGMRMPEAMAGYRACWGCFNAWRSGWIERAG